MIKKEDLAHLLVFDEYCNSLEEAMVLSECVLNDVNDGDEQDGVEMMMTHLLQEYLGVVEDQARNLTEKIFRHDSDGNCIDATPEEEEEESSPLNEKDENEEDDDDDLMPLLFDGECELCDRYIKLTRHHLMPKSTWSRMESRLRQASSAKEDGDMERVMLILGPGLLHLVEVLSSEHKKSCIREILTTTCDICRPCHDTVHRTHDNITLALSFNTIDQLLQDEKIAKFAKWASKQKTGKWTKR